ncbi:MAG: DUF3362 domain-containing protein, partial [Vibrio sp.]
QNEFECDQVQNFYPSPMCNATAMYYSETNPLKRVKYKKREDVPVAKGERQRRLHKALLRYHDPANWPMIREALINMGKKHLIGDKPNCLVPFEDVDTLTPAQRRKSGRHGANRFQGNKSQGGRVQNGRAKPGQKQKFATKHTEFTGKDGGGQPDIRREKPSQKPSQKPKASGNKAAATNQGGQQKPSAKSGQKPTHKRKQRQSSPF